MENKGTTTTNQTSTRTKEPNYTQEETQFLVKLVSKFLFYLKRDAIESKLSCFFNVTQIKDDNKDIVEGKKTDVSTKKLKDRRWEDMAQQFRDRFKSARTTNSLVQKWDNLKKAVKKKLGAERQEIFKTGGGQAIPVVFSELERMIVEIIGQAARPLANPCDSDALADSVISSNVDKPDAESTVVEAIQTTRSITQVAPVICVDPEPNSRKPKKSKIDMLEASEEILQMKRREHEMKMEIYKVKLETQQIKQQTAKAQQKEAIKSATLPNDAFSSFNNSQNHLC